MLQLLLDGLTVGAVIALVALGLTLVFGIQRFVNVAHADFVTIGAYATFALAALGIGFLPASVGGVLVGAGISYGLYLTAFRPLRGRASVTLVVTSIGVGLVLRFILALIWGMDSRTFGLPAQQPILLGPVRVTPSDAAILGVTLLAVGGFYAFLRFSRIGIEMRAVADIPELARVSGINIEKVALWTWIIAGALAAIAGVALGVKSVLTPLLGWNILLPAFAATVLGGIGSPHGAVVGGFLMGMGQELSTIVMPSSYKPAVAFVVVLLVLFVRPSGIFGAAQRV